MRPVSDPLSRALPFDAWPQLDRHTWEYATRSGDVFSDAGTAAHWRPATTVSYMGSYGRWLRFLDQNGLLDPEVMPDERVTQDRIGRYISTLESRLKPVSIWSYVSDLHNVLYRIAPEHDWSWLRHIINRLHLIVPRGSISPDDLLPIGDLYQAGFDLMENATREAALHSGHGNGSTYYRDGLMISMLTVTLLRPGNFARITLDNQLVRCPDLYQLTIPADEIKNGRHYETGIPDSLTRPLDQYLDHVRPQLLGNNYTPSSLDRLQRHADVPECCRQKHQNQYPEISREGRLSTSFPPLRGHLDCNGLAGTLPYHCSTPRAQQDHDKRDLLQPR